MDERIKAIIGDMPTYGYRGVHALLRRAAREQGGAPAPNHKRVWRVMKAHDLLLQRHAGGEERRHGGRVAVDQRNRRWCSDGFEIGCDNGDRVRVVFALDCCDREAISYVAITGGISGDHVRDLMVAAVERRFGQVNRLTEPIEWLSDNGSWCVARETRDFARDIGLEPRTTPIERPRVQDVVEQLFLRFNAILWWPTGDRAAQSAVLRCKLRRAASRRSSLRCGTRGRSTSTSRPAVSQTPVSGFCLLCFDLPRWHPMVRQGRASPALSIAAVGSLAA